MSTIKSYSISSPNLEAVLLRVKFF